MGEEGEEEGGGGGGGGGEEEVGGGGRRRRLVDGDLLVFKGSGGRAVVTNRILRRHIRKLTDGFLSWGGAKNIIEPGGGGIKIILT